MGDAYLVYGVTQGKYLLQDGIAFGTDFPEGIDEDELILKIKNMRGVNEDVELDCFLTEYWNGVKCVPYEDESFCDLGTELVDDVCIVVNPELDPMLTPIRNYDYGLIYMIILVIVGIISGVVGGIIFVIRRNRK